MAPTSKEKNPCQNVNIVLLVDKHATHTHWDLEQVSGLYFFFASQQHGHVQPSAETENKFPEACAGSTRITRSILLHILDVMGNLIAVWALVPQKSSTFALESVMAQMNRAGADLIRNELQAKTNCPYANVDDFVDTDDVSSLG